MPYQIIPPQDPGTGTVSPSDLTGFTATRVPFGDSATALTTSADLTFNDATNDLTLSAAESGGSVGFTVANASDTASSDAAVTAQVAGTSANDAVFRAIVAGTTTWSWGVDNSDSDKWKLADSSDVGTSPSMAVTTGGVFSYNVASADAGVTYDFRETSAGSHSFSQFRCSDNAASALTYWTNSATNVILEARASGSGTTGTYFGVSKATTCSFVSQTNAPLLLGVVGNEALYFGTNDVERMRISSAGLVGIGAAPIAAVKFSVTDAGTANDCFRVKASDANGSAVNSAHNQGGDHILWHVDGSGVAGSLFGFTRARAAFFRASTGTTGLVIGCDGADPLVFGTNNTETIRIDTDSVLKAAAASEAANNAQTVTVGNVGPGGAGVSIQQWLKVKDSSGNTRYIPMFG